MMKQAKILSIPHSKKWFLLLFLLLFAQITTCDDAQSPPGLTPTEGLLCISDCATCPVMCSPPPSLVNTKSPPCPPPSPSMPRQPSPPWRYYSPSQPYFRAPPPASFPLPLSSPPPPPTHPPPSISWGNAAPPPPPPPPSLYYGGGGGNVPSIQAPPGMGRRNYSYPYYYYYASKASSSSFSFIFLRGSTIFVLLLSIHVFYFAS